MLQSRLMMFVCLFIASTAVCAQSQVDRLAPEIHGDWWKVAYSPKLPSLDSPQGELVDHCFILTADGTWDLWTQIRGTRHGRVYYRWTGAKDFENNRQVWKPQGLCWVGDPHAGEMPRVIQAPTCYWEDGKWSLFYGGGGSICRADSTDGRQFVRHRNTEGFSRLFEDLSNRTPSGMRDPYLVKIDDRYHLYYTWKDHVMCRTADRPDADTWSKATIVSTTPAGSQCPTVVKIGSWFYLFKMGPSGAYRTEVYASRDPMDFGKGKDQRVAVLEASAAEVIQVGDQWYISSLIPRRNKDGAVIGHDGVRLAKLVWRPITHNSN